MRSGQAAVAATRTAPDASAGPRGATDALLAYTQRRIAEMDRDRKALIAAGAVRRLPAARRDEPTRTAA